MRTARLLGVSGLCLCALGVVLVVFGRPILEWERMVIGDFGYEFDSPTNCWSLEHGRSTVLEDIAGRVDDEAKAAAEELFDLEPSELEAEIYLVNMFDVKGSAKIHIGVRPISNENTTPELMSAAMQKMHELGSGHYRLLSTRHVTVDGRDAFRRTETYTEECPDCSLRSIVVVTYLVENGMLYQISLVEENWLDFVRNVKIYNHIVRSLHLH